MCVVTRSAKKALRPSPTTLTGAPKFAPGYHGEPLSETKEAATFVAGLCFLIPFGPFVAWQSENPSVIRTDV